MRSASEPHQRRTGGPTGTQPLVPPRLPSMQCWQRREVAGRTQPTSRPAREPRPGRKRRRQRQQGSLSLTRRLVGVSGASMGRATKVSCDSQGISMRHSQRLLGRLRLGSGGPPPATAGAEATEADMVLLRLACDKPAIRVRLT